MARPRKAPTERRDDLLAVRLTSAERAELAGLARAHGLTVAEFMRRCALSYELPPLKAQTRAIASLAAALMPIGVNLNQLTRTANAGRLLPSSIELLALRITALLDGFYGPGPEHGRPELSGGSPIFPPRQAAGGGSRTADVRTGGLDLQRQFADRRS